MSTPQSRLKEFILSLFPTIQAFAKFINMANANLYKYLTDGGSVFKTKKYIKILTDLGLNYNWYITGEGEMYITKEPKKDGFKFEILGDELVLITQTDMVEIPSIDSAFPCGVPQTNEGLINKVAVRKHFIEGMRNPYHIRCTGDSMSPRIQDGDELLVDTIDGDISRLKNRSIVVACINNEFTIKRLLIEDYGYLLAPDNIQGGYSPYLLRPGDEMKIIAVVKKIIHNEDC